MYHSIRFKVQGGNASFWVGGDPTGPNMGVSKTGAAKNNCDDL